MKTGCWNGSRLFSAFVATSGYFTLTWIQKVVDIWSCLKHTFKATVIWDFMQIHPLLTWIRLIHLVYSQMGLGSFPFQFRSLLCLGSDVQYVLKAEIGVHTPAGRKKALAQSFSKSLLMFETHKKSQFTHHPHAYSLALNAAILSQIWIQLSSSHDVTDWGSWTGWICHTSKFSYPFCVTEILCQWWLFS